MSKIKVSKLDKRIVIQEHTNYQNEKGFDIEDWIDFKTVWASINNLYGKEFYEAKAIQEEKTVVFTVRYNKSLEILDSKLFRIKWNKKIFDITFIDNVEYRNKWLKIKGIEK